MAVALVKMGHKVGLLDADVYRLRRTAHAGREQSAADDRREPHPEPLQAFGLKTISVGFLNPGDKPIIWRGPMLHQIIRQFLGLVEWGQLDYLIVDMYHTAGYGRHCAFAGADRASDRRGCGLDAVRRFAAGCAQGG